MVKIFLALFAAVNFCAFGTFGIDKLIARRNGIRETQMHRISEKALFLVAIFGGAPGAFLGMKVWRHKAKHWYFVWGIPALALSEIGLFTYCFFKFR